MLSRALKAVCQQIKKLVDWFEDLLWKLAIEDVFSEYYLDVDDKDGDTNG